MAIFANTEKRMIKRIWFILLFSALISSLHAQSKKVLKDEDIFDPDTLQFAFYSQLTGLPLDTTNNLNLYKTILEWLGVPYRFGGESKRGIDCSSFCSVVYNNVYSIPLASSSKAIFGDIEVMPKEELREGDFVFFKIRRGQISHIGVYLGNDKFVHASRSRGVMISDLNEDYYRRYFYKGGRLKPLVGSAAPTQDNLPQEAVEPSENIDGQ